MKIGLYLQNTNEKMRNIEEFNKAMAKVKKSDIDLLVFPEYCYTPFACRLFELEFFDSGQDEIYNECLKLSEEVGCAIVFSSINNNGIIYSFYANAGADEEETEGAMYIKHTATKCSAFDIVNYTECFETLFEPIILKGKRIGMTICFDCNHPLFSRVYGKQGIDILVNSTGGDVIFDKWHKYNKVRAIENNCFNFVTMAYAGDGKKKNSYVYGFSPNGNELPFTNLFKKTTDRNEVGTIYVYDTDSDDHSIEADFSLYQKPTVNKYNHINIPAGNIESLISKSKKVDNNLYVYKMPKEVKKGSRNDGKLNSTQEDKINIVFCIVDGQDIFKPEEVLKLLYNKKLSAISDKRYVIVNRWEHLSQDIYMNKLSDVLKVRSMENYCAVVLESDNFNNCYQCGNNRTAQVVMMENDAYGLDLGRTTGPESIWKDKRGTMKAEWRNNFEELLQYVLRS